MRDSSMWYLARKRGGEDLLASSIWGSLVIEVIALQNSCERGKVLTWAGRWGNHLLRS
jgi:hypothetical protein